MAIRGEPAGGRDQSRHNLVSGRSEDPNHDAVMRIGSEAPKRRTHSSNRHESQGALPGFRHLEPSSAFHHKRTDKAETVGVPFNILHSLLSIRQCPAAVEDRAVPGHWEGDLLSGSKNSYIATLVERHTRYVMLAKVSNKDTQTVISALIKQAKKLPNELYKSLTWDRGKELTDHRRFTLATDIDVYFCDPQSPWQRGSNENTNGLLRQYFPKGADLSVYSQADLNKVARRLNERPRETLGFETPAERFNACVASTG